MPPNSRPRLVAITGNIASGKSEVCKWLENNGYTVYYADKIAHKCLQKEIAKKQLYYKFGEVIFAKNGRVDRAKLAKIVFGDKTKLQLLNSIIHPLVRQEMQKIIDETTANILIFEIPLLFETGLQTAFDLTVNVSISRQKQKERLKTRGEVDSQQQQQRINSQMNNEVKNKKADLNLDNNGTKEELHKQLKKLDLLLKNIPRKPVDRLTDL